ncbi:MAG: ABC transporter permease, partial [Gammaproteobacteria bacterium]
MIRKSSITEAGRSLYASKQRTILALIGIMIGIGSVIAMISVGQIVSNESLKQFRDMGTDLISIEKGYSETDNSSSKKAKFTLDTTKTLKQQIPAIHLMSPVVTAFGEFSLSGIKGDVNLIGITPEFISLNKLKLRAGRFITDL